MTEKRVFMPLYATDFLWSREPDCTALYGFYSKVEKLLSLTLDTASLCWTWLPTPALQWSTDENSDVMDIIVISVSCLPIELEFVFFFMKRHSDSSFCPTKKNLHLCAVSLANSSAEFKLNAAAPADKRQLATIPYIL